jgi:transcriptional regulator GlxA family with amidase domain
MAAARAGNAPQFPPKTARKGLAGGSLILRGVEVVRRTSTACAPHQYVLLQRIERAKQSLRDSGRSIIDAGLDAGFQNPSHFARAFRKVVGTSPSNFRSETSTHRR